MNKPLIVISQNLIKLDACKNIKKAIQIRNIAFVFNNTHFNRTINVSQCE